MTLDEARKLAGVVGTADGGCSNCVPDLIELLNASFPEFVWSLGRGGEFRFTDTWEVVPEFEYSPRPTSYALNVDVRAATVSDDSGNKGGDK